MVKQAESHASEDKARREEIEARNQLDALVYRVEKDSKEWVDKLPAEAKSALDAALETGKESLRTGDANAIKSALDGLNTAYSTAGAAMYQNQQASAEQGAPETAGAEQPSGAKQDDVVEADYEIVDDKK